MDNGRFDCDLARDLMPLAADGQAGSESVGFLEDHINKCESCRKEYSLMRGDLPTDIMSSGISESGVSGRKRLSTGTKLALAAAVYAAVVIILLILLFYKMTYMLF